MIYGFILFLAGYTFFYWGLHHGYGGGQTRYSLWQLFGLNSFHLPSPPPAQLGTPTTAGAQSLGNAFSQAPALKTATPTAAMMNVWENTVEGYKGPSKGNQYGTLNGKKVIQAVNIGGTWQPSVMQTVLGKK